jgi:hypothetical protein
MRWFEKRHRFTDRTPDDPLPRRHPTHEHPYHQDTCALCETTYAPDEGLRADRNFYFAAHDAATTTVASSRCGAVPMARWPARTFRSRSRRQGT